MRRSDQLVLQEDEAAAPSTTQSIVSTFRAEDDFEKELNEAMVAAGTTEKDMIGAKSLPVNENIRDERQIRQVAKLKALMLREQQASKRVKKIKSKAYRRIHRKSETKDREALLERLGRENPELAKALKQEFEKKHAQLRMLRKRNARRKWATTMQRFAKGDDAARQEISKQAQIKRDEEMALRRAVRGQNPDQSEDSEAADLSGSDSDDDAATGVRKQTINRAKKLTVNELKNLKKSGDDGDLPTTGILGLGFMRDAIKRKREAAKAEAEGVLKELEGLDAGIDADLDAAAKSDEDAAPDTTESLGAARKDTQKIFTAEELAQASKEVDAILDRDDNATECTVSGPLTIRGVKGTAVPAPATSSIAVKADPSNSLSPGPGHERAAKASEPTKPVWNPWLEAMPEDFTVDSTTAAGDVDNTASKSKKSKKASKTKAKKAAGASKGQHIDADDMGEDAAATAEEVLSALNADSQAALEQRDLVRTVFVQGAQEEDFDDALDAEEREKLEAAKKPEMLGWGSWTGEGVKEHKKGKGSSKGKSGGGRGSASVTTNVEQTIKKTTASCSDQRR
jgi:U3 small nucleolar RNA-associated protein 14